MRGESGELVGTCVERERKDNKLAAVRAYLSRITHLNGPQKLDCDDISVEALAELDKP